MYVPSLQDESVRDPCRLREDLLGDLNSAKLRVKSFLLRHDIRYEGKDSYWYLRRLFEELPTARTEVDLLKLAPFRDKTP